jgi:hypothetical protein
LIALRDERGESQMNNLVPCPACSRHVRSAEVVCPFCSADLPKAVRPAGSLRPPARLGRLALFTAGATLVGVEACYTVTPHYGSPAGTGGTVGNTTTVDGGNGGASGDADAQGD